jgi:putative DNA methylase
VFAECRRVLKDDGVLAFTLHHSREEGWAAIYEAIIIAGLEVVAAYPVHAELRAASSKTATKDPISLDALLVCRKHASAKAGLRKVDMIVQRTSLLANKLLGAGMELSSADHFVIAASQMLISASAEQLSFEQLRAKLENVRHHLAGKTRRTVVALPDSDPPRALVG